MSRTRISEAFRRYGAKLHNVNWSVSSWATDGALVVSLWTHHYQPDIPQGRAVYADRFDCWSGPGNAEFRRNIKEAFQNGSDVKLVLAHAVDSNKIEAGEDGSKVPKNFSVRDDLIGKVTHCNYERYEVTFEKRSSVV